MSTNMTTIEESNLNAIRMRFAELVTNGHLSEAAEYHTSLMNDINKEIDNYNALEAQVNSVTVNLTDMLISHPSVIDHYIQLLSSNDQMSIDDLKKINDFFQQEVAKLNTVLFEENLDV